MGFPSSSDSPTQYIFMVHNLIEQCLVFNLSKEECMEALSKRANINPIVTSTVWKELEKENKEFFESYNKRKETTKRNPDEFPGTSAGNEGGTAG